MPSAPTNTHAGAQRGVTSSRSHSTPTSPGKGPSSSPLRWGARKYQPSVDPAPGAAQAALAGTGEPWSPPSRGATRATAVQLPGQLPAEARRAGLVLRNSRDLPGVCRAHRARGRPGARGQHWCRSRGDVPVRCVCVNPASPCSCPVPGIPTSPSDGARGHVPGLHRRRVGLRCCGCTRDLGQGHPAGERSDASRDAGGILARSGWEGQKEAGEAVETHGHPRVRGLVLGFPGATVLLSDANVRDILAIQAFLLGKAGTWAGTVGLSVASQPCSKGRAQSWQGHCCRLGTGTTQATGHTTRSWKKN